jgi:hypothetical protein
MAVPRRILVELFRLQQVMVLAVRLRSAQVGGAEAQRAAMAA